MAVTPAVANMKWGVTPVLNSASVPGSSRVCSYPEQGICVFQQPANHCMAGLMVGDNLLLLWRQHSTLFGNTYRNQQSNEQITNNRPQERTPAHQMSALTCRDSLHRIIKVLWVDSLLAIPGCMERCLIADVGDVSPCGVQAETQLLSSGYRSCPWLSGCLTMF